MKTELLRLSDEGLTALPPSKLPELAQWSKHWCEAVEDVRYCVIQDVVLMLNSLWEGTPKTSYVDQLDDIVMGRLRDAIEESDPSAGLALAQSLREDVKLARSLQTDN